MSWTIDLDEAAPPDDRIERSVVLEVDPRRRSLRIGLAVVGASTLDTQSGAVARSELGPTTQPPAAARTFLTSPEAGALLDRIEAGYTCELLWTGDPVATWSEDAWQAGHTLLVRLQALLGATP